MRAVRYALVAAVAACFALGVRGFAFFGNWSLNSLLLAVLALGILFARFEEREMGSRELAAVGMLAALAAAGRVLFAAVPGLQPATFLVILTGYVFGADSGFMVGALTALLSNLFLGQGPWTPWQMLGWGLAGVAGGLLGRASRGRVRKLPVAALSAAWGFVFGWGMNLWFWLSFVRPHTLRSFMAACLASFWFDLLHAAGNLCFALFLTVPVASMLTRFRERFSCEFVEGVPGEPAAAGGGEG